MTKRFLMTALSMLLLLPAMVFAANMQVTSSCSPVAGGNISPVGIKTSGTFINYSVTTKTGYTRTGVAVSTGTLTQLSGNKFQVPFASGAVKSIVASFAPITYTITTSVNGTAGLTGTGGQLTVAGGQLTGILPNAVRTITVIPLTGYQISALTVDGTPVPAALGTASYVAYSSATTANHSVAATFAVVPTATVYAGVNKTVAATTGGAAFSSALTGTVSSSPAASAYLWTVASGPAGAGFTGGTTLTPTFTGAALGTYTVTLRATVGGVNFTSVPTTITVIGSGSADTTANSCIVCHAGSAPVTAYAGSAHDLYATTCQNCHTGSHPGATPTAATCVACHAAPVNHTAATSSKCLSCHNAHNLTTPATVSVTSAATAQPVQHGDPALAAATGYAGSTACSGCHTDQFAKWSNTLHNKPLKQLSETGYGVLVNKNNPTVNTADNDFVAGLNFNASPVLVDKFGVTYSNPYSARVPNAPILGWAGGVYPAGYPTITIGSVTYKIDRAHGGNQKWKQRYQTKIGSAYYVLNVMFNEGNGRYAEYNGQNWYGFPNKDNTVALSNTKTSGWTVNNKPIFSNASGALVDQVAKKMMRSYGLGNEGGPSNSSWDNRCTGCHQTGMQLDFNANVNGGGEVRAGYIELNIGCEACHGPGAAHAAAPAAANILQPQKTFVAAGAPNYFKAAEVCGQCHNRTDGAGHLGADGANLVNLPTESPSAENAADRTKVAMYNINSTDRLVEFVEYWDPGTWGTPDNSGTLQYDGFPYPKFTASNQHHQQNLEIEQGKHGAVWQTQAGNSKGLSCWSCHDPHAANSSNIKSSINGVATNKDDNTICLACHNSDNTSLENADFTGLAKSSIGDLSAELAAVNAHLTAKLNKNISLAQYQASITMAGSTLPTYGLNSIKLGNCVSCHMPLTTASGILRNAATAKTAANGDRGVGDIHSHTMKTMKASAVTGATNPAWTGTKANGNRKAGGTPSASVGMNTSCSACHGVSGDATAPTGGWFPASGSGW